MEDLKNNNSKYLSQVGKLFKKMKEEKDEENVIHLYCDLLDYVIKEAKKVGKERVDDLKQMTNPIFDQNDPDKNFDKLVFWHGVTEVFDDSRNKYKFPSAYFFLRWLLIVVIAIVVFVAIFAIGIYIGD
ncbi:hypothetical protein ACFL21_01745 [Patescibacteria group bacterium]